LAFNVSLPTQTGFEIPPRITMVNEWRERERERKKEREAERQRDRERERQRDRERETAGSKDPGDSASVILEHQGLVLSLDVVRPVPLLSVEEAPSAGGQRGSSRLQGLLHCAFM
jgi:hypothetical protein